jgi:hypothetical protein
MFKTEFPGRYQKASSHTSSANDSRPGTAVSSQPPQGPVEIQFLALERGQWRHLDRLLVDSIERITSALFTTLSASAVDSAKAWRNFRARDWCEDQIVRHRAAFVETLLDQHQH